MTTKADIVRANIATAGSKFVSVTFIKKTTGEERTITFNPMEDKRANKLKSGERAEATAKRKENNPDLINVIDTSIANKEADRRKGWRSFSADSVVSMTVGGVKVTLG